MSLNAEETVESNGRIKRKIYENCAIFDPNGKLLSYTSNKRAKWYLKEGLAEAIQKSPLHVKLGFFPKNSWLIRQGLAPTKKENICVVCGSEYDLERHHILPYCYIRLLPEEEKIHRNNDIVSICTHCHAFYERRATALKRKLVEDLGFEFQNTEICTIKQKVRKAANTLVNYRKKIPKNKKLELMYIIKDYFEIEGDLSKEDIERAKVLDVKRSDYICPSKITVENYTPEELTKIWRKHFIESTKSFYLPLDYGIDLR